MKTDNAIESRRPVSLLRQLGQPLRDWALRRIYGLPEIRLSDLVSDCRPLKPAITDDICMPPYCEVTDHDDFTPLMRILIGLQPNVVVELGTAHGNTVANICYFCPETRVITVNAPVDVQSGSMITFELSESEIGRVYRNRGFGERVSQIFENTLKLDLSHAAPAESVDAAIVDACHDTDFVINDFHKVQSYLRPGGVVLLHDTHPCETGHLFGSYIACMKLRRQGFDIRHISDSWWGFWRKPVGG